MEFLNSFIVVLTLSFFSILCFFIFKYLKRFFQQLLFNYKIYKFLKDTKKELKSNYKHYSDIDLLKNLQISEKYYSIGKAYNIPFHQIDDGKLEKMLFELRLELT